MYRRVFVIVCDSLGFGSSADAAQYGDAGADTIGHVSALAGGLTIPNMGWIGATSLRGIPAVFGFGHPHGRVALLSEASLAKDTIAGHWEMMGVVTDDPFVVFPDGFPQELISELEEKTSRHIIGNKAESGTVILEELASLEVEDPKNMIVYTSGDSVLQICGREDVEGGLEELYRCCEIARKITLSRPEWKVARVIARPYVLENGKPVRTVNRKDYAVAPPKPTVLEYIERSGMEVIGIGKIEDIFAGDGITRSLHSENNEHGMKLIDQVAGEDWQGLCFANLSDFDVLWGHRRDPRGYARAIEAFDVALGNFMEKLGKDDLLIITADHGNDPTWTGTDHTREDVPFLSWSPSMEHGEHLGHVYGFACVGASIADALGVELPDDYPGQSLI